MSSAGDEDADPAALCVRRVLGDAVWVDTDNDGITDTFEVGPDPASQATCKIGGVVNNNSSGMCCGVAQNTYHTMARLRIVLTDGTTLDSGDPAGHRRSGADPHRRAGLANDRGHLADRRAVGAPVMNQIHEVDVLVVGAGPVGLFAAYYSGFRGLSVTVVDSLPELGGVYTFGQPRVGTGQHRADRRDCHENQKSVL